jgi:hypothetical protein
MGQITQSKSCKNCETSFEIYDEDITFYNKIKVPPPTHCPDCRQQRRWGFRNEFNLYKRKCDFSGQEMISLYSSDKPYKVYNEEIWWSDKWDPLDYGRDFDFSRPFFPQFQELLLKVPRRGMQQNGTNENCKYITFGFGNKNSYLIFACFYCEDVYHSRLTGMTKDSMDCYFCVESELLYECISSNRCYNCAFLNNCKNCHDSYLLEDCNNCQNCICCKNLRNKKYHIYNKPVSKQEFEKFRKKLLDNLEEESEKFSFWKLKFPNIYAHISNSENCTGEYIENCKNCHDCFQILLGAQDLKYCQSAGWNSKDMYDCSACGKDGELLYEMQATAEAQRCSFTSFCTNCSDLYYCDCIKSCQNCFACSGLNHKKYCILNKQYSQEEYESLIPKIIEHMKSTEEWGEFPPLELSPFCYNETIAQQYFPLTREQTIKKGYKWKDSDPKTDQKSSKESLECEQCSKNYKIIEKELKFYKKQSLPIPKKCPECRYKRRFSIRNSQALFDRECRKCRLKLKSSYSPDRSELIYCEKCYLDTVA